MASSVIHEQCRISSSRENDAILSNGSFSTNPTVVEGRPEAEGAAPRSDVEDMGPDPGDASTNPTVVDGGTVASGALARNAR